MSEINYAILLGAGASKNFGGYVSSELFPHLLSNRKLTTDLRRIILNNNYNFDIEEIYYRIASNKNLSPEKIRLFHEIVAGIFLDMDRHIYASIKDEKEPNTLLISFLVEFFNKCDTVFTLNQDLLLERLTKLNYSDKTFEFYLPELNTKIPKISGEVLDWYVPIPESNVENNNEQQTSSEKKQIALIKLHGSMNWYYMNKERHAMVFGRAKSSQIQGSSLLSNYLTNFKDAISKDNTRLLIVGYSFNDPHINYIIGKSAQQFNNFELYIITPDNIPNLIKSIRRQLYYTDGHPFDLQSHPENAHIYSYDDIQDGHERVRPNEYAEKMEDLLLHIHYICNATFAEFLEDNLQDTFKSQFYN